MTPGGTFPGNTSWTGLALYRQRLYAARNDPINGGGIDVWDVSDPHNPAALTSVDVNTLWGTNAPPHMVDLAVQGSYAFFTYSKFGVNCPCGVGVAKLGSNRDGSGAQFVYNYPGQPYPMGSPVVVGDTLYVGMNAGLAVFDLTPLWSTGSAPVARGNQSVSDLPISGFPRFFIEGSFGYMSIGGDYRVFDLR